MADMTSRTATCVEPGIERARDLNAIHWYCASEPMSLTRRAGQAAFALDAFFSWTPEMFAEGPTEFMLTVYREEVGDHLADEDFDVALKDLVADLWHLSAAYGIRLDAVPVPRDSLATDLRMVLLEIREAVRGPWAADFNEHTTPQDIETEAHRIYLNDCADSAMTV